MALTAVPFTNFAFGEYGSQSPFGVGFAIYRQHLLYRGWWTGRNVARSIDGTLFPQPWPVKWTTTGLPGGDPDYMGIAYDNNQFPAIWLIYKTSGDVYLSGPTVFATSITFSRIATAALAGKHVYDQVASGNAVYLATDDGVWQIAVGSGAASRLSAQKCSTIAVYGDRLVAAGGTVTAFGNRVYYSAAGDFTTWPANNYFDVGDGSVDVTKLLPIRGSLAIAKHSGADSPWWMLRGVPGVNDVLRPVNAVPAPGVRGSAIACALRDGTIGFFVDSLAARAATYPAVFNGSAVTSLRYLAGEINNAFVTAVPLSQPGDWALWNGASLVAHRDDAWSVHDLSSMSFSSLIAVDAVNDQMFTWRPGDSSIYAFSGYPQRPAFTTDVEAAVPPAASCFFSLPEWWARDGSQVAVQAVFVDFIAWNTGDTNPNTFTVNAVAMRTYDPQGTYSNGGGEITVAPNQTYSEAAAKSSTAGTRKRFTVQYVPTWGNGFRLDFSNFRGVSIQKVVVQLAEDPPPGI